MVRGTPRSSTIPAGKRVVIVLWSFALGGAERQAMLLARQLKERAGADVRVWALTESHGPVVGMCDQAKIPWHVFPMVAAPWWGWRRDWLSQLVGFALALRRERPHVLLPYCMLPNVVCGLVWRLTGAKICIWNQRDGGQSFCPELERWAVRLTRCFVSNSTAGEEFLATTFALPRDEIHVVPNGVELAPPEADRLEWRSRLGLSADQIVACMIANITSAKDHATLIRAWRRVVDRLPEHRPVLLLAGMLGATAPSHQALAEQLRLQDHVRFLGPVSDIAGLLSGADLGVFSSALEGCPNGVLECMAAGLAVVATDIAGTRDVLGSDASDQFVPVGDPVAMAERIVTFGRDVALRRALGLANQCRIQCEFSPERMYQNMLRLIAFPDGKGELAYHG